MPRLTLMTAFAALATICFAGCSVVRVDSPMGEAIDPEALHRFVGEWEQVKGDAGPPLPRRYVRILRDGRLRVSELKWSQDKQEFSVLNFAAVATSVGKTRFLNLETPGSAALGQRTYFPLRYRWAEKNRLELFPASFSEFKKLIDADALVGEYESEGQNKSLSIETDAMFKWLEKHPGKLDSLFPEIDGKAPISAIRVRRADGSQQYFSRNLVDKK